MLLRKKLLPHDNISEDMQKIINELKQSKDKEDCLLKTYNILTSKYRGGADDNLFKITSFDN